MSGGDLRQRLAAILAADAAGYLRLMSLDERATVNALDAARKVFRIHIESNQGRVIDMGGDSVLAVFETATGAVNAAMAIQAEVSALADSVQQDRRMRFRIGVHLGDVIENVDAESQQAVAHKATDAAAAQDQGAAFEQFGACPAPP